MYCTSNCTKDTLEILYYIFAIIGSFSIIIFLSTYLWNKKRFNHDILIGCNLRYQDILKQLPKWENPESHILKQYLDLCSDELFYHEKEYIGDNIINDWLDGMMELLPHLVKEKNNNKQCKWFDIDKNKDIYNNYKRVKATFSFKDESEYERFKSYKQNNYDYKIYEMLLNNLKMYSERS